MELSQRFEDWLKRGTVSIGLEWLSLRYSVFVSSVLDLESHSVRSLLRDMNPNLESNYTFGKIERKYCKHRFKCFDKLNIFRETSDKSNEKMSLKTNICSVLALTKTYAIVATNTWMERPIFVGLV